MSDFKKKLLSRSNLTQLIKFAMVGFIGTIINISILFIFTEVFNVYYIISEIIAFLISGIHNYIINKIWTFNEVIHDQIISKYMEFIFISIIGLLINISVLYILVEFFGIWYIFAEIGAIFCAFLINFFGNNLLTFKKKVNQINT